MRLVGSGLEMGMVDKSALKTGAFGDIGMFKYVIPKLDTSKVGSE